MSNKRAIHLYLSEEAITILYDAAEKADRTPSAWLDNQLRHGPAAPKAETPKPAPEATNGPAPKNLLGVRRT